MNKAAYLFGALFIVQGVLFLILGIFQSTLSFRYHFDKFGIMGMSLIWFALIIYPVLEYFLDHIYPSSPTFGLLCPTTIFTFGILLMNVKKCSLTILVFPFFWSVIGFMAAFQFGILEDMGLLVASLVTTSLLIYWNNRLLIRKVN
ncbi:DUF6064 family protein [Pseudanabaena galeata UHCC 0370]|uniref:DUF6064 family protein n=1 Tax=Pseudanabaena galeata UHCC 0370 TaxID=3110310 RepID=A0ABU5TPZ4_9CYAN|nr:DUF6064 family protein [Pseudanabaena galeata]MEA5480412.1 DUF6064 family protein [Pseudanabaena galeata UHCC 0370]